MDTLLYIIVRSVIAVLQALPLRWVARIGRTGGAMVYWLDARHRKVVVQNLTLCFGREKSAAEIRALAKENFKRIGENFSCAVKTAIMTKEQMQPHFVFTGAAKILAHKGRTPERAIIAIGHFGNFELYARFGDFLPGFQCATTYRGLRQPSLNRLMQSLRAKSGCHFFERRTEAAALKAKMGEPSVLLGLLCDQHAGKNGLRLPFLGHDCSTSAAPAVFALRYDCFIVPSICYRTGLAHWEIEIFDEIATHENGEPRSAEAIMLDVNRALETAVRRDPANWFWVHKRWKPFKQNKTKVEDGELKMEEAP